jgi:hypothetical protein
MKRSSAIDIQEDERTTMNDESVRGVQENEKVKSEEIEMAAKIDSISCPKRPKRRKRRN